MPSHVCEYCNKSFPSPSALITHRRVHTKERPYQCEYCNKSFTQNQSLTTHRRIHTKERPYQCEYCPESFPYTGSLINHRRIHTKERPHQCEYCSKSFRQKYTLTRHRRIHTNKRPYQCKYCNDRFTRKDALTRHQMAHESNTLKPKQTISNIYPVQAANRGQLSAPYEILLRDSSSLQSFYSQTIRLLCPPVRTTTLGKWEALERLVIQLFSRNQLGNLREEFSDYPCCWEALPYMFRIRIREQGYKKGELDKDATVYIPQIHPCQKGRSERCMM